MVDPQDVAAYESVSTWAQPEPVGASPARQTLVAGLATRVVAIRSGHVRVVVDGRTASGKTSFGHELARAVRALGRPTLRASLDDFKHPWRHAREHGYDRTSGEGYYRNPWDVGSVRDLLLGPMAETGDGVVTLCAHDPLSGVDHRDTTIAAPPDAVLVVDGVFALRPAYDDAWDLRIWLEVDAATSLARGVARDSAAEGADAALALHRDRYAAAEEIYLAEVDPLSRADVVVDNTDLAAPRLR